MSQNPKYIVLFHYFRLFLQKAHEKQIDVAPIKGAHLLTSVYPEGADRGLLADVDFLVKPADFERACEILVEMGFEEKSLDGRPVTKKRFYERGFYLHLGGGKRIMFEPHRYLVQQERLDIDYDVLWARSTLGEFDGMPCRRLSNEDHFLYHMVHLTTHCFIRPRRELGDLAMLLMHGGVELERVSALVDEWQVRRGMWLALSLLAELEEAKSSLSPDLKGEVKTQAALLAPPTSIALYLRMLVPDTSGFIFPHLGLRAREALLWPALFNGVRHFAHFLRHYATLRIEDLWAELKMRNDKI